MQTGTTTQTSSVVKVAAVTAAMIIIGAAAYAFGLIKRDPASPVWYLTYGQYNEQTGTTGYGYNGALPFCNPSYGYNQVDSVVYGGSYGYGGVYTLESVCQPTIVQRNIVNMEIEPSAVIADKGMPLVFKANLYDEYGKVVTGNYPITWKVGGMANAYFGESSQVLNYVTGMKRGQYHITAQYTTVEGKKLTAYAKVTIK